MAGTAPDVARFFDALLVDKKMLEPRTLERMLKAGPNPNHGLGISRASLGSCRLRGQVGSSPGWSTAAFTEPRSGTTFVVLLRGADSGDAKEALLRLARRLQAKGDIDC
jgi:hypothetical protein